MAQRKSSTNRKRVVGQAAPAGIVTTNGSMRLAEPTKSRKRRASKPKVVTLVGQTDDVFMDQVGGFTNFLREYAVVGLAVGFIVGQQASGLVKQLVASFFDPWVKIIFGQDLSSRVAHLHHHQTLVLVPWGAFVYDLIEFFLVLIAVYLLIKIFKLDKLKKIDLQKK